MTNPPTSYTTSWDTIPGSPEVKAQGGLQGRRALPVRSAQGASKQEAVAKANG